MKNLKLTFMHHKAKHLNLTRIPKLGGKKKKKKKKTTHTHNYCMLFKSIKLLILTTLLNMNQKTVKMNEYALVGLTPQAALIGMCPRQFQHKLMTDNFLETSISLGQSIVKCSIIELLNTKALQNDNSLDMSLFLKSIQGYVFLFFFFISILKYNIKKSIYISYKII